MHIVIFGAGAVGGVIGGRLYQHRADHGHDVTLVARGTHYAAIRDRGLTIHDPSGSVTLDVPVVDAIDQVELRPGDVVILTMKTQDTTAALADLAAHAPAGITVVCAQNGVENERLAIRLFDDVHGICVMTPATFLEPGVVDANGAPHNAILDVGRYPSGVDPVDEALAAALTASGLVSEARPAIMRWKYRKLVLNLANALDAVVVEHDAAGHLAASARAEAEACYAAAGIDAVSNDEDRARRDGVMAFTPIEGRSRGGWSTWQTLARQAAAPQPGPVVTEVEWLNGEIVLLGRLHGVATPVNALLQEITRDAIARRLAPRSIPLAELERRLDAG